MWCTTANGKRATRRLQRLLQSLRCVHCIRALARTTTQKEKETSSNPRCLHPNNSPPPLPGLHQSLHARRVAAGRLRRQPRQAEQGHRNMGDKGFFPAISHRDMEAARCTSATACIPACPPAHALSGRCCCARSSCSSELLRLRPLKHRSHFLGCHRHQRLEKPLHPHARRNAGGAEQGVRSNYLHEGKVPIALFFIFCMTAITIPH